MRNFTLCFWCSLVLCLPSLAQGRKAPEWVHQTPLSSEFVYGVGVAWTSGQNYRAEARQKALQDIAEKLFVSVDAQTELRLAYKASGTAQVALDERISTATANALTGYEKRAEWRDRRNQEYYVLFALDRSTYERNRNQYFESVAELASRHRTEATLLLQAGDWVHAIDVLGKTVERLDAELNGLLEPNYQLQMEEAKTQTMRQLEKALTGVTFAPAPRYSFRASDPSPLVIPAILHDSESGRRLQSPEVTVHTLAGDLIHYEITHTDYGEALTVYGMVPDDGVLKLYLRLKVPLNHSVKEQLNPSLFTTFQSDLLVIQYTPYALYYEVQEQLEGYSDPNQPLTSYLASVAEGLHLERVNQAAKADYRVVVRGTKDIQPDGWRTYKATYSAEVRVYRQSDHRLVFREALPSGKGSGDTARQAGVVAFNAAMSDVSEFLMHYLTFLCDKPPR